MVFFFFFFFLFSSIHSFWSLDWIAISFYWLIGAGKTYKTRVTKKHSWRTRKAKVPKKHCFGSGTGTTTTASSSSSSSQVEGIGGTPSLKPQQQPVNISNSPDIIQNNNNNLQELLAPAVTKDDLAYLASINSYSRQVGLDSPPHTNCLCSQRRVLGSYRFFTEEEEDDIIFNGWWYSLHSRHLGLIWFIIMLNEWMNEYFTFSMCLLCTVYLFKKQLQLCWLYL